MDNVFFNFLGDYWPEIVKFFDDLYEAIKNLIG